jgi:hypothetical protein
MKGTYQPTTLKARRKNERDAKVIRNRAITPLHFIRACATTMTMLVSASVAAQNAPYDSEKLLPHTTLFEPGIISTGDYESRATFTPNGREMYFLKLAPNFSRWSIFVSRYKDGRWSQPEVAPFLEAI